MVTMLPFIDGWDGLVLLFKDPQDLNPLDLGLGRLCDTGEIGLGSMLTGGLTGFRISICSV